MTDVFNTVVATDAITVTIKYGSSYEETWAVFKGIDVDQIRKNICEYFGVDATAVVALSTHELVVNLTALAHGSGNALAGLGAVPIPPSQQLPEPVVSGNPWAGVAVAGDGAPAASQPVAAPVESDEDILVAAIGRAVDVKTLQLLYKDNKDLFSNEQVMDAYKARGKELTNK